MKKYIALFIVVFLFTGAKPDGKSAIQKPVSTNDHYEQLPERLDKLSEKMEAVSQKVKSL
jgi:hypothetical protein